MSENQAEIISEDFSPEEAAYFESGGSDTSALLGELSKGLEDAKQGNEAAAASSIQAEAKPATAATPAAQATQNDGQPKMVPITALHEEREARKAEKARVEALERSLDLGNKRLELFLDAAGIKRPGAEAEEKPIDPEADLFGAFKQAMKKIDALEGKLTTGQKQTEAQNAERSMMDSYKSEASATVAQKPEFREAYVHLMQGRIQEYKELGYTDDKEIMGLLANEEKAIVAQANKSGRKPTDVIYNLAVARGFKAAQNQQQQANAPSNAVKSDAEKQLEAIEKGQKASNSLTGAGGSAGEGLTMQSLADMSQDEFEKTLGKLSKSEQRRLFGG